MKRKICVVTATRADYGLLRWIMQDIKDHPDLVLQTVVTGGHLSQKHGMTVQEILRDGFSVDAQIQMDLESADATSLAASVGDLFSAMAVVLNDLQPDLVVILGDRYELLGIASACVLMTVPLAHIAGGEITEGAIDEQIRHAVTKMAHLHFVANDTFGARVRQLGEEPWRVCVSGEPGLDNLYREDKLTSDELSDDLGLDLSHPTALVTFHPVTLELDQLKKQLIAVCKAMDIAQDRYGLQYVITYPGVDPGSDHIVDMWHRFVEQHEGRRLVSSLGQKRYFSALREAVMMIGNSSSGIIEAPSFNLPVVNIGTRQDGRLRAVNVIDVGESQEEILGAIADALAYDRSKDCDNPYGDGRSAQRVVAFIDQVLRERRRDKLLRKKFVDFD